MTILTAATLIAIGYLLCWLRIPSNNCPRCGRDLDRDNHGYDSAFRHCHRCGFCTKAACHSERDLRDDSTVIGEMEI